MILLIWFSPESDERLKRMNDDLEMHDSLVLLRLAHNYDCAFYPGSIQAGNHSADRQSELLYFSLVTLSTVEYGDVVPHGFPPNVLMPSLSSFSASRQTAVFMFLSILMGFSETLHAERIAISEGKAFDFRGAGFRGAGEL